MEREKSDEVFRGAHDLWILLETGPCRPRSAAKFIRAEVGFTVWHALIDGRNEHACVDGSAFVRAQLEIERLHIRELIRRRADAIVAFQKIAAQRPHGPALREFVVNFLLCTDRGGGNE